MWKLFFFFFLFKKSILCYDSYELLHLFSNGKHLHHKKNTCRKVQGYQMIQHTSIPSERNKELLDQNDT
jgi:hypothetical protein